MNFKVLSIPPFDKQLKRLVKKFPSLKGEFAQLLESLEVNPLHGTSLGNSCYKIRISIASKGKGKSGGARLITNIIVEENTVFLISIYDKAEKDNLSNKELLELLKQLPE
ncbi:MAG: type II toxin-antitoxin system RelE/ParE family toxin [Chitinophagaceae bacterium]